MSAHSEDVARWTIGGTAPPLVATAIHDGHDVRAEVADLLALDDDTRRREEDPHTRLLTAVAPTRIVGLRSRFEIDLNRPRNEAVCRRPADCWGLPVWRKEPPADVVARSLGLHDAFYDRFRALLSRFDERHGGCVVLDIHSYNHRRGGPEDIADPRSNPELNVGTGTMDRERWGRLVERFIADLRGDGIDARENVKFRGRYLARSTHDELPETGCCLALEFKKSFMDEWTGALDAGAMLRLVAALRRSVPGLLEEHGRVLARERGESVA